MACHILCSIPDAYDKNTVIPFRCALPEWIKTFREMLWMCEDGLGGHWYVLGLIATHTWCKPGHCSSVAVNSLSGVKSEPPAGYLANPPFWTISIVSKVSLLSKTTCQNFQRMQWLGCYHERYSTGLNIRSAYFQYFSKWYILLCQGMLQV